MVVDYGSSSVSVGEKLRLARKSAGVSAAALAARTGVTEAAIRKIESGGSKQPSFLTGLALARELGVSPFILGGLSDASLDDVLARAIRTLRMREPEHRALGVAHAAIFGSVARGQATKSSDVDVLLELQERATLSLLKRARIADDLSQDLGRPVDVVRRDSLPERGYESALAEAIYAY